VIDTKKERLIGFSQGGLLPTEPSYKTLRNWYLIGRWSNHAERRVFLEAIQIGGRYFTSIEAYHRFVAQLNGEQN
jgi:hypothetical protein